MIPKRNPLRLTIGIVERLKADDTDAIFQFGVQVHATGHKVYVVQSRGSAGLTRGEDPISPAPAPEPTDTILRQRSSF